jgi:phage FluMu gp28-like protein
MHLIRLKKPDEFKHQTAFERESWMNAWLNDHLKAVCAQMDQTRVHYVGVDFGRTGDLSVFWFLRENQNLSLTTSLVLELRNIPFEQQRQILFYLIDHVPRFMAGAMDATGNGAYLAEVAAQRYGASRISEVKLSQNWYLENMPKLVAFIEDINIEIPQDADILDDLRSLQKVNGIIQIPKEARNKSADGEKRHGDAAIALALGIFAVKTMNSPIEFTAVPKRRTHDNFDDDISYDKGCY